MTSLSLTTARARTSRRVMVIIASCLSGLVVQGCQSIPFSGRQQLVLIPESQEIHLGVQAFEETLASEPLSNDAQVTEMVERVGRRIAAVAGKPDYDWEFRVVARDVQNGFALPGGKVAVYEGILPICQSEAGLAVVMSHEIAHVIARHGGERMSQQSVVDGVGSVVNTVSQKRADEATTQKIMQVYGVTSQYGVVLPFSRKHESEADAIGLILMARAGYDPSVAPEFWERFSATAGSKPPEWLSTHPADARRSADLRALLPEAMKYYEAAQEQYGMGDAIPPVARLAAAPHASSPRHIASGEMSQEPRVDYGSITALTSAHSVKKSGVTHAHYTEPAEAGSSSEQSASAEAVTHASADFQLPVKSDGASTTDVPVGDGWGAARSDNPFAEQ